MWIHFEFKNTNYNRIFDWLFLCWKNLSNCLYQRKLSKKNYSSCFNCFISQKPVSIPASFQVLKTKFSSIMYDYPQETQFNRYRDSLKWSASTPLKGSSKQGLFVASPCMLDEQRNAHSWIYLHYIPQNNWAIVREL